MKNLLEVAGERQKKFIYEKAFGKKLEGDFPDYDLLDEPERLLLDNAIKEWRRHQPLQLFSAAELLTADSTPQPMWGNYWNKGEVCLLTGDGGSGKSLLAIQLAKALATGTSCGDYENCCDKQTVLFCSANITKQGFSARYGKADNLPDNLYCVQASRYNSATLTDSLIEMAKQVKAELLIIDGLSPFYFGPMQWVTLLEKLNALRTETGISVLITLDNKSRYIKRALSMVDILHYKLLVPFADSVISLARCHRAEDSYYMKALKVRNGVPGLSTQVEMFCIEADEMNRLLFKTAGYYNEEDMLPISKQRKKELVIMQAEQMLNSGYNFVEIASHLDKPVSTVRGWLRGMKSMHNSQCTMQNEGLTDIGIKNEMNKENENPPSHSLPQRYSLQRETFVSATT